MKKILFLGFFSITSLLAFSQLRIPIKVFSAHEETCHGGVRTTFNDYVIKIYGDSTIEILDYSISTPVEFSAFTKSIYFGKYELKKDSVIVKKLYSSRAVKYNNPQRYLDKEITQEPNLISNIVFVIKEDIISSSIFFRLTKSSILAANQLESKFQNWDRTFIGNKIDTKLKSKKKYYLDSF